eukprot:PhF_6_TR21651/c0_g1_i2/m.30835
MSTQSSLVSAVLDSCKACTRGDIVDESQHLEDITKRKFKGKAYRLGHDIREGEASLPVAETLLEDFVDFSIDLYDDGVLMDGKVFYASDSEECKHVMGDISKGVVPDVVRDRFLLPRYNGKYHNIPTVALRMADYSGFCYNKK